MGAYEAGNVFREIASNGYVGSPKCFHIITPAVNQRMIMDCNAKGPANIGGCACFMVYGKRVRQGSNTQDVITRFLVRSTSLRVRC